MANNHHTTCAHCGKEIHQHGRGRKRKFCSRVCLESARRKPIKNKKCAYCSVSFTPHHNSNKYCSSKCFKENRKEQGRKTYKKKQSVFICNECGVKFLRMPGGSTKWCSEGCKPLRHRTWWKMSQTICTCEACGEPYIPKRSHEQNKYCSKKCCSASKQSTCIECGVDFISTGNTIAKFCSVSCAGKHNLAKLARKRLEDKLRSNPYSVVEWRGCHVCGEELGPRPGQAKFCQKCKDALGNTANTKYSAEFLRDRINGRECSVCGESFTPYHESSSTCSVECYRRTADYKGARSAEKMFRRAKKKKNGQYEKIDPYEVFERDNWTCYLCGVDTPRDLRGTYNDNAPELDHIVSLKERGPHTMDNVACSCRKCNQVKTHGTLFFDIETRAAMVKIKYHGSKSAVIKQISS